MLCYCSKFFGVKDPAPQQQTKLSFATKAPKKKEVVDEDGEGDVSAKENADPETGEFYSFVKFPG